MATYTRSKLTHSFIQAQHGYLYKNKTIYIFLFRHNMATYTRTKLTDSFIQTQRGYLHMNKTIYILLFRHKMATYYHCCFKCCFSCEHIWVCFTLDLPKTVSLNTRYIPIDISVEFSRQIVLGSITQSNRSAVRYVKRKRTKSCRLFLTDNVFCFSINCR